MALRDDVTGNTLLNDTFVHEINGEVAFARGVVYFETTSNPYASNVVFADLGPTSLPTPGSSWSANHPQLVLKERIYSVVGVDAASKYKMKVDLIYRLERSAASVNSRTSRGTSSLSQTETIRDSGNSIIRVTDPSAPTDATLEVSVPTIVQEPRCVMHRELEIPLGTATWHSTPEDEVLSWIGYVNDRTWRGGAKRQWLCVHVSYEPIDLPNNVFHFEFEFERISRLDGWVYDMVFPNSRGVVPTGVSYPTGPTALDGVGIATFLWHPERNFALHLP